MKLTNWGKYPVVDINFTSCGSLTEAKNFISDNHEIIGRGLGRCYGDSALSKNVISLLGLNKILHFDQSNGEITCEAGIRLGDILESIVSKGWFLPVVPGTKFVTLGGAIASDIHGKNHHTEGSISNHIKSLTVLLSDGSTLECTKEKNSDLFWATCGGMGLTGIILQATLKLKKVETAYIKEKTIKCNNLEEIMNEFEKANNVTYSVAWIDCLARDEKLGRGILMLGEHAKTSELHNISNPLKGKIKKRITIPFDFPEFILNPFISKLFNSIYYIRHSMLKKEMIIDYDSFFFPLDSIHNWNKAYGKRGLAQYQFVLPKASSKEGLKKILTKVTQSGQTSFLATLKLLGKEEGLISFPKEGYTLSLDFPITKKLFQVLNELDIIVNDYGGRIYLTKDARMNKETFNKGYKNAARFRELKHKYDEENKFQSLQSKRIEI